MPFFQQVDGPRMVVERDPVAVSTIAPPEIRTRKAGIYFMFGVKSMHIYRYLRARGGA